MKIKIYLIRSPLVGSFVPNVKTNVGTGAFAVAAPTVWDSLPVSVKSV